jgi:hypothetical protein
MLRVKPLQLTAAAPVPEADRKPELHTGAEDQGQGWVRPILR